ncbi:MAG TPA: septum formation protein Maf [Candidatus Marinimicrobia bacterium]|nr:septum formation protein Maf [Candidatus Neomarinimicrobiota bacterium]HIB31652.1 septum formation protein Maf [Candidatus Neomarinimicrobiota bacterium]
MEKSTLILASGSPRRKQLLTQIGLDFQVVPNSVNENHDLDLPPEAFAEHWGREKAKNVAIDYPDNLVIGADTIVVLDKNILGKPKDKKESFGMLKRLSGRTHEVITGVAIIWKNKEIDITFHSQTYVTFREIPEKYISFYIDNYSPLDKAGSYGIQDWFSVWVEKVDGCYFNVMGLPLSTFYQHYQALVNLHIHL